MGRPLVWAPMLILLPPSEGKSAPGRGRPLELESLSQPSLTPARERVLDGLVRVGDRIPAYRLSGDATMPGLGPVAGWWRESLGPAVVDSMGRGLLVDLRSSMYAGFWRPPAELAPRVATVRVLHEVAGRRQVVSHF